MATRVEMPDGCPTPPNHCLGCEERTAGGLFCVPCGRGAPEDLPPGYVIGRETVGLHTTFYPARVDDHSRRRRQGYPNERAAVIACRLDLGRRRRVERAAATYGA